MPSQQEIQSVINDRLTNLEHESWGLDGKGGCRGEHFKTNEKIMEIMTQIKEVRNEIRDVTKAQTEQFMKASNFQVRIITGITILCFVIKCAIDFMHK